MKKAIYAIYILLLVGIDQLIKYIVVDTYNVGEGFNIIKNILTIEYIQNTGAAWGMMSNMTWLFAIFAIVVTSMLLILFYKIPDNKKYILLRVAILLLISGAVGNLIDRIVRGFVVDYIYFKLINFPVFNLADIFITISGIGLVLLILFYYKDEDFEFLKFSKHK